MSVKKAEDYDSSMKKLNATASYDIINMHEDSNELDQSYGRLGPDVFPSGYKAKLSIRSPNNIMGRNFTNQTHIGNSSVASQSMSNLK